MTTEITIPARFVNGKGLAHRSFGSDAVCIDAIAALLGSPMIGTFNLEATPGDVLAVRSLPPAYTTAFGNVDNATCHLCELKNEAGEIWPVFMYQWHSPDVPRRVPPKAMIETISRARVPDSFKTGALAFTVYRPFTVAERDAWIGQQRYWFQTFPWGPTTFRGRKNADSALQWRTIEPHAEWMGRTVMDIGGAAGYHCFEASKRGAIVTLVDLPDVLNVTRTIGRKIECRDIRYLTSDSGDAFDVILYLSVHHQIDGTYKTLPETVARLKARCHSLFIELIDPVAGVGGVHSVRTGFSLEDVNAIMGSAPLLTYKHNVRAMRHIWKVDG